MPPSYLLTNVSSLVFGCQAFDSSDPTAVLKEALLLFLPGADVAAGGRDLLAQVSTLPIQDSHAMPPNLFLATKE
eukprot:COSAG05_NODE_5272_length_1218_cov_0.874888_2_plen_74_part_01